MMEKVLKMSYWLLGVGTPLVLAWPDFYMGNIRHWLALVVFIGFAVSYWLEASNAHMRFLWMMVMSLLSQPYHLVMACLLLSVASVAYYWQLLKQQFCAWNLPKGWIQLKLVQLIILLLLSMLVAWLLLGLLSGQALWAIIGMALCLLGILLLFYAQI